MTSLEDIKTLREKTGASLQACKKALEESNGDETAAIEILRKNGESKMASRSERDTSEGVIATAMHDNKGVIVKLACETDFVAKNPDFVQAAQAFAKAFLDQGASYDASTELSALNLKMGEKVELAEVKHFEGATLGAYIHSNQKLGAMVALEGGSEEMARDIAMHITAMNPLVLSPDEIDSTLVAKEREIWTDQLKQEGKPAEIIEKILLGKEKKFREENALLKQPFVKNPDQSIEQFLGGATLKTFVRMEC